MALTNEQLDILKAWIVANVPNATEHTAQAALNATAVPAFKAYRIEVLRQTILENGFDWTRLDNLSVGKARVWSEIFVDGKINPSKPNVRAGINSVWVGTAQDLAVRATVYGHCVKDATEAEKLLKVAGAGTAPDGNGDGPATLGFVGLLTLDEVISAMNRP